MARARGGPLANFPAAVKQEIEKLAAQGETTAEIVKAVTSQFPNQEPTRRTIERYIKSITPTASTDVWRWTEAPSVDARHGLDVLEAVIVQSRGRRRHLTHGEAEMAIRIRAVEPALPPWSAYVLARRYLSRQERGDSTEDLDTELALAPWRDAERRERYERVRAMAPTLALMFQGVDAAVELLDGQPRTEESR